MIQLKSTLTSILSVVPQGSRIWYLDYPVHGNIGDLLIMAGTRKFFADNHIALDASYCIYDFPKLSNPDHDVILVFHGGGNFGDIYPRHQLFREQVISAHSSNRVVILPQTAHYSNTAALIRTQSALSRHPDLHIFVRDDRSHSLLNSILPNANISLLPDMAHCLYPINSARKSSPDQGVLYLMRRDSEATISDQSLLNSGVTFDWDDLYPAFHGMLLFITKKLMRAKRRFSLPIPIFQCWSIYADYLIGKAVKTFSDHSLIVSSRMHGHILACLMNKQNIVFDNSYGKNRHYFDVWTAPNKYSQFSDDDTIWASAISQRLDTVARTSSDFVSRQK